jgi:replicative DNA helicase
VIAGTEPTPSRSSGCTHRGLFRSASRARRCRIASGSPGRDLADVAELAQRLAAKVATRRKRTEMTPLGSLINPAFDRIESRMNRKVGISTGFRDLDRLLGGLRRKQLITVAGATSMGKSLTLIDMARHIAVRERHTVAFFTLEMDNDEVFDRILAAESNVLHQHIRDGEMDDYDWAKVSKQIGPMANAPLFLSDVAPMNVAKIKRACEDLQQSHGSLDVVFVDHMHLVKPSSPRIVEERAILEDVANGLKSDLAMSLDLPVVAAAQLNRNTHARTDKTPQLSDLKGSSAIEQMSNVVVIVHRPEYYDADSPRVGEADFVVAKSRDGSKGVVTVAAQVHLSRFVDMSVP